MKLLLCFIVLVSFNASATNKMRPRMVKKQNSAYQVGLTIKRYWEEDKKDHYSEFKSNIKIENGKNIEINSPDNGHSIELFVSEELPEGIQSTSDKKLIYYEMKIYQNKDGAKKLLATPEVIVRLGEEAKISSIDEHKHGLEISLLADESIKK